MANALTRYLSVSPLKALGNGSFLSKKICFLGRFILGGGVVWFLVFLAACQTPQNTRIVLKSTPSGAVVSEAQLGEIGVTNTEYIFDHERYAMTHPGSPNGRCAKSFVFTLPGYESERITKEIMGEEVTVHAVLEHRKTKLRIKCVPGFAAVRLTHDGRIVDYAGKTPNGLDLSDPSLWNEKGIGLFDLEITAPGYKGVETTVELTKGRNQELSYILREREAVVHFRSIPEGVDVYDRSLGYLGRTPFSIVFPGSKLVRVSTRPDLSLNKAQLQLSFEKRGFRTVELVREIRVGEERENVIQVNMK